MVGSAEGLREGASDGNSVDLTDGVEVGAFVCEDGSSVGLVEGFVEGLQ